jgi:hypothetical protein
MEWAQGAAATEDAQATGQIEHQADARPSIRAAALRLSNN